MHTYVFLKFHSMQKERFCNSSVTHSRVSGVLLAYLWKFRYAERFEPHFARATYVPRTCDVPSTFPWRICIRMEFHFRMYGVSRRMCYVRVTYVWRMKGTRDVSTAYTLVLRSILICGVCVLYQLLFNTYENKRLCSLCSWHSHLTVINYQRLKMIGDSRLTPKKRKRGVGGGSGGTSPCSISWS